MSDHHAGRHCTLGSTAPSGDDLTENCESCGEAMQDEEDAAPVLPADFWEQPEIRSALLSRHFGRFLRTYRTSQSPQIKQSQLARWLGITQGQLSRIERSSTPIGDLHKLDAWARALHVPLDRLWFNPASASSSPDDTAANPAIVEEPQHNEESDVRRRDSLKVTGLAALAAAHSVLSDTPWQRLIDSLDKGRPVDTATVQLIHDRTVDLFYADETVPSRELLTSAKQHRNTIQALLENSCNDPVRNHLVMALGERRAITASASRTSRSISRAHATPGDRRRSTKTR